jgi:hypothetical protein|nr:MAG TPA: Protein of unknown function (DUF2800) [Caudoviricetes sp.]DAO06314.1 MAG TPA: Protein of unknown function (DUF2800) [Caudoviricetes sp.]
MAGHKDRAHALLSASGAHRWMNCTPSAVLESQFPDTTSEAAKEGTLAHEMAEAKLQHLFNTQDYRKAKLTRTLNKIKKDELYQPEMDGYTDDYVAYVRKSAMEFEKSPYIAIEKRLDLTAYIPDGFGTADCVMIGERTLHIIDLKYGKGVPVSAENNEQLMIYALGALEAYKMLFAIDTVKISIVQPRIDNTNSSEYTVKELMEFGDKVKHYADIAIKGDGEQSPGDWCRFCRARQQCRARADKNIELAFEIDKKPPLITNEEVGEYLRKGEDVAKWLSELQDYALAECLAGRDVDGYKAVEGRGSRAWTDMDAAFEAIIEDGTDEALLYERKPLTLAQVEKLMGKAHFEDVAGEYVVKNPGKPTLVPSTDKRQAITNKISANEAFK